MYHTHCKYVNTGLRVDTKRYFDECGQNATRCQNAKAEQEIFCTVFFREKSEMCGVMKQELSIASTDSTESPVVDK